MDFMADFTHASHVALSRVCGKTSSPTLLWSGRWRSTRRGFCGCRRQSRRVEKEWQIVRTQREMDTDTDMWQHLAKRPRTVLIENDCQKVGFGSLALVSRSEEGRGDGHQGDQFSQQQETRKRRKAEAQSVSPRLSRTSNPSNPSGQIKIAK